MSTDNCVIFKGRSDSISVILDRAIDFENIITAFAKKLSNNMSSLENSKIIMNIEGRKLDKTQKEILLEMLLSKNITQVSFKDNETNKNNLPTQIVKKVINNNKEIKYSHTGYWSGILRSGQEIIFEGNAIVIGDVNPGAIIRARENIIVLGNLNGRAFAGENLLREKSYIIAYGMNPEQIGIGEYIANAPQDGRKFVGLNVPEMAYLDNGNIHIEKIDAKLMQFI